MQVNDATELPDDVDALRAMVVAMQQQVASSEIELKKANAKVASQHVLLQLLQ